MPVEVREWIAPALASPDFVLVPEPPAQPHSRVVVERAIRFAGGADTEVIGPSVSSDLAQPFMKAECGKTARSV